jgi:PKD domain-containing protein
LVACFLCGFVLALPAAAGAITFGPTVKPLGPEEVVFDHNTPNGTLIDACEQWDIPDQSPRAFKDDRGNVQLHFSHMIARRNVGTSLDDASKSINDGQGRRHDCTVVSYSNPSRDPDPSHYADLFWIAAPYTLDGHTVYSLVHEEWRGPEQPAPFYCPPVGDDQTVCWYNAITFSVSNNSGDFFTHAAPPGHVVASVPYRWVNGTGPYGVFTPSNIIKKPDGFYYSVVRQKEPGVRDVSCLIRTQTLNDPKSWRAWDGSGFNMQFVNPYDPSYDPNVDPPSNHLCADIGGNLVTGVSESLTYNTYFGKYMLVGAYGNPVPGFFYSLSDDLIHWSYPKLLIGGETAQSFLCGDPDPMRDPSVLDPTSTTRADGSPSLNFETTGRQAYLYYTVLHTYGGCTYSSDRDLLRVKVEFNKDNASPTASFTLSPNPAQPGQSVNFNGLSSSDPDGTILNYKWDLDGDGTFETDTGSTPTVSHSYGAIGTVTIGLLITDDNGGTATTTRTLTIKNPVSPSATPPPSHTPSTSNQTSSFEDPACAAVRTKKRRLQLLLASIRRNFARAKTARGKRHYRLRIASVKRQLKRLAVIKCKCPQTRKKATELEQRLQTARNNFAAAQTAPDKTRYRREIKSLKLQLRRLGDACRCADKRRKRRRFQNQLETAQRKLSSARAGPEKNRYQRQIKALKRKIQRLRCSR